MRDPERVPRIVSKLFTLWEAVPDWRLAQLMSNTLGPGNHGDMFYTEDDEIERGLDALIAQYVPPTE